ncbi:MAG: bifunctional DNA-binding transcriptional regulator/O6-methylguanine-DNA methyltransferase Ada [Hyphomicrobium sp.]|jgi:AraC family transcriptional regulator of adaptative response/methylated-DNA-[protein]-cysteine methyltransferase
MQRSALKSTERRPTAVPGTLDDRACWQAVVARDAEANGRFVYGVTTTGVYCRPSCGARLPLRRNARFFASCEEAEAAGLRACKRCKPGSMRLEDVNEQKIAAACRLIEGAETPPTLDALAQRAGLSRYHFHRLFKSATGVTPKAYATAHRDKLLREALRTSNSVVDASYEAGFGSSSRLYEGAARALGMKPGAYRSGGANMLIRYGVAKCSLGLVLAAASEQGICGIFLADTKPELEQELRTRFPHAALVDGDADFRQLLGKVVASIDNPRIAGSLPLDIRGTAFQQRVWAALRDIGAGETATYAEIARRIGKPKAGRAVGAACGANPIAVAVPCHRVVGSGGKLTGYRWGVERKRRLIARERDET